MTAPHDDADAIAQQIQDLIRQPAGLGATSIATILRALYARVAKLEAEVAALKTGRQQPS